MISDKSILSQGGGKVQPPPAAAKPDPNAVQNNWLAAHRGKSVTATLIFGDTLHGTLVANDVYTLLVQPADGGPSLLVFKSALAYLREADGPEVGR